MNILLIDDDADDRMIFLEAIKRIDPLIRCQTVHDGIEAQSTLTDPSYLSKLNCIFLDLRMPGIDGLTLLKLLRTDKRFDVVPICVYATSDDPEDVRQIRQSGAKFLKKHDDFDECIADLREILTTYALQETITSVIPSPSSAPQPRHGEV